MRNAGNQSTLALRLGSIDGNVGMQSWSEEQDLLVDPEVEVVGLCTYRAAKRGIALLGRHDLVGRLYLGAGETGLPSKWQRLVSVPYAVAIAAADYRGDGVDQFLVASLEHRGAASVVRYFWVDLATGRPTRTFTSLPVHGTFVGFDVDLVQHDSRLDLVVALLEEGESKAARGSLFFGTNIGTSGEALGWQTRPLEAWAGMYKGMQPSYFGWWAHDISVAVRDLTRNERADVLVYHGDRSEKIREWRTYSSFYRVYFDLMPSTLEFARWRVL